MRVLIYQLGIKHVLPQGQPISKLAQDATSFHKPKCFRSVFPVGIAAFADEGCDLFWLRWIETPENLRWQVHLANINNRIDFLIAVNTISFPLCARFETCDVFGDEYDLLEYKRDETQIAYDKASQALYVEIYGRN